MNYNSMVNLLVVALPLFGHWNIAGDDILRQCTSASTQTRAFDAYPMK
jgi:hypothetical protein